MSNLGKVVLKAENLSKVYDEAGEKLTVLDNINLELYAGQFTTIMGASGSGKTTLLHMLAGLDVPTTGSVALDGQPLSNMTEAQRGQLRNHSLGFVYQFHHLLMEFSALENVAMPLLIRKVGSKEALQKAREALVKVGLEHRLTHKPGELSGGERQRVAIARAIVGEPALVLADEPSGNLDSQTAGAIKHLLKSLCADLGTTFLIVTHDPDFMRLADRHLTMQDGCIVADDFANNLTA